MTKLKSNAVISFSREGNVLNFDVIGAGSIAFHVERASAVNREHAEFHGWRQRIVDAAAISRDSKTGKSATPAEKLAAMAALVDFYHSGGDSWTMAREGAGRAPTMDVTLLIRALGELYPKRTSEQITAFVKKQSSVNRLALANGEKIKPIIERLAEEAIAEVDAADLMDELESE